MWNVLSSTVTSQHSNMSSNALSGDDSELLNIVSQTLCILLQLEMATTGSFYTSSVTDGTKLYHIMNVCLFPEGVLSDDYVGSALEHLLKQAASDSSCSLVKDFIKACFEHSRLSKESRNLKDDENDPSDRQLQRLFSSDQSSSDDYTTGELKALDDFVDDLCNSYIEYGGQYAIFTRFIRFFLRHDFPAKVTTSVLTKLYPILSLLTVEEEEIESLLFSLTQSVSGGLPSVDSSRRDPSSVLDSFAVSLKKKDKELSRSDYVYLLAVAVLGRNLASSSQRFECGLQAIRNRLSGVSDAVFYDVIQVSEKFVSGGGTKDTLLTCVVDTCREGTGLMGQDVTTQQRWRWNSDDNDGLWERAINSLASNRQHQA